jgi:hypothetical protein
MSTVLLGLLTLNVGCPQPIIETHTNSNGDSGNVLGVVIKIADDGAIGDLNSAEWQVLTDKFDDIISQLPPDLPLPIPADVVLPQLTDAQALALVEFLDATGTNNFDDLPALVQQVIDGTVVIPQELVDLLIAIAPELEGVL